MPTSPPKTSTGGTSSAATATASKSSGSRNSGAGATISNVTGVNLALQSSQALQQTFNQLNQELMSYSDPHTVGRNPILLKSYFDQIVAHCMQIATSLKVTWTPPSVSAAKR